MNLVIGNPGDIVRVILSSDSVTRLFPSQNLVGIDVRLQTSALQSLSAVP